MYFDCGYEDDTNMIIVVLTRLEEVRSPADKARILVEAHKVVVGPFPSPSLLSLWS